MDLPAWLLASGTEKTPGKKSVKCSFWRFSRYGKDARRMHDCSLHCFFSCVRPVGHFPVMKEAFDDV